MTLVEIIQTFFKKYIYAPHQHDWKFDTIIKGHVSVMGLETDTQDIVYKCTGCGEVKILERKA